MQSQDMNFLPAGSGEQFKVLGSTHSNKLTPTITGGAFSAVEITVPPRHGPPLHSHDVDSEYFYVLEGELTFSHPGGSVKARAGDSVFLPARGRHGFRNDGDVNAKALIIFSPGEKAHRLFRALHEELDGAVDESAFAAFGAKNGVSILAPQAA
jgi:quercetin dioxygenase-like cupin family protein